ncbi:hypothetical protein H0H87_003275 [Tephrocybe sp. NHM501043]|nr:hypothetical protein H0H87_003275 [Tephrocybe sp. NHM501043]
MAPTGTYLSSDPNTPLLSGTEPVPTSETTRLTDALTGGHLYDNNNVHTPQQHLAKPPENLGRLLYVSHFLSTWNSRLFEFGAILFVASIFVGTLLPTSAYALTRAAAAIIFSPVVGGYIDSGNRLRIVRLSIGKFIALRVFCIVLDGS